MSTPLDLQGGARTRLAAVTRQRSELLERIAQAEATLAQLRAQLPGLEFEEAAMRFILEGAPAGASIAVSAPAVLVKLSRPELIARIEERMREAARPLEVSELHRDLSESGIDLGANARNYLCGVLSRSKDTHFVNVDKGAWWLAGHPLP